MKEPTNGRANSDAVLARAGRVFLAIQERSAGDAPPRASAGTISSLRRLSSIKLVHDDDGSALLLRRDAGGDLGSRGTSGDDLRRPRAGDRGNGPDELTAPAVEAPERIERPAATVDTAAIPGTATEPSNVTAISTPVIAQQAASVLPADITPVVAVQRVPPANFRVERREAAKEFMRRHKARKVARPSRASADGASSEDRRWHPMQQVRRVAAGIGDLGRSLYEHIVERADGAARTSSSVSASREPSSVPVPVPVPTSTPLPEALSTIAYDVSRGFKLDHTASLSIINAIKESRLALEVVGLTVKWYAADLRAVVALSSMCETPAGQNYLAALADALPAMLLVHSRQFVTGDLDTGTINFDEHMHRMVVPMLLSHLSEFDPDDRERAIRVTANRLQVGCALHLQPCTTGGVVCGSNWPDLVDAAEALAKTANGFSMLQKMADEWPSRVFASPDNVERTVFPPPPILPVAPIASARTKPATIAKAVVASRTAETTPTRSPSAVEPLASEPTEVAAVPGSSDENMLRILQAAQRDRTKAGR